MWLQFNPQAGHEQRGKRPALVLSPKSYNSKVGLALFCPITSKVKGYPFEVMIEQGTVVGAVLSDQIKSLDWRKRQVEFIEKLPSERLADVIAKIRAILD
ncbi:MAG: type II toxin-antitoxin system PemK/MazF family toxin [Verrucomicrobiales bacterium]|nr:type II toxin-antitoxin system PemK/MazF family toxin [Verrucomicrobiales bacterium]